MRNIKAKKIFLIVTLMLSLEFSGLFQCAYALSSENILLKKQAYCSLAEVLYDKSVYLPFRIDILKMLAESESIDFEFNSKEDYENKIANIRGANSLNKSEYKKLSSIIEKLKENNNAFAEYIFQELLDSDEAAVKDFSRHALNQINKDYALPVYKELSQSTDFEKKVLGIKGLARINTRESAIFLTSLLDKASLDEKKLITDVLANLSIPEINKSVEELVRKETNPEVIINSAIILINTGKPEYESLLKEYLMSDNLANSRYAALKLKDLKKDIDFNIIQQLSFTTDPAIKIGILAFLESNNQSNSYISHKTEILKMLKKYIFDNSEMVSIAAIRVLASCPFGEINSILKPLAYNPELNKAVISVVLNYNNRNLIPTLEEFSKIDNEQLKFQIAKSLIDYDKKPYKILRELSENGNDLNIRLNSSILLSKLEKKDKYLKQLVNNENEEIRKMAILYLADVKDKSITLDNLKRIAFQKPKSEKNILAAFLLLKYNDDSGFEIIRNYFATRKPLNLPQDYLSQDVLIKFLTDKDDWVKINSAYNLSKFDKSKSKSVLKSLLSESADSKIRAASALILGKIGNQEDLKVLENAFNDPNSRIKATAALSAIEIMSRYENIELK